MMPPEKERFLPGMSDMNDAPRSVDVLRIVRERLEGFRYRQEARVTARKRKRAKKSVEGGSEQSHFGEEYFMKSPVIFRAKFKGLRGQKGTFAFPGEIEVEIFHFKVGPPAEWRARRPGTTIEFKEITPQSRALTLKEQIPLVHFKSQVSGWEAWDSSVSPCERLQADEWATDKEGRVYLTEIRRDRLKERRAKQKESSKVTAEEFFS